MPHIPLLKPESAPDEVKAVYTDFHRRMSFPAPPNFILAQGHSRAVVQGSWDVVRNILVGGEIPRWMKEMMFVAISKDRGCHYCTAAHIACCRMLGVKAALLDQIIGDVAKLPDAKLREMILFALKCSRDPKSVNDEDYKKLREQGLENSQIVEIIGMAALAVYANIIADATAVEPDEMFDAY
jgi:uncharacterized peroxidase-related enzyme